MHFDYCFSLFAGSAFGVFDLGVFALSADFGFFSGAVVAPSKGSRTVAAFSPCSCSVWWGEGGLEGLGSDGAGSGGGAEVGPVGAAAGCVKRVC